MPRKFRKILTLKICWGGSENPSMENLFNGDNMSKIFTAISSSVGEMGDSSDLLSEATNICGVMKDNPIFGSLLNMGEGGQGNDMMAQMMQGMMGGMMGGGGTPHPRKPIPKDTSHSGDATRERLRRKLQDKQSNPDVD